MSNLLVEQFLQEIEAEEIRAHQQHGEPADRYEMLAILGEEYGELQKAILDFDYDHKSIEDAMKECIQVGAMALKMYKFLVTSLHDDSALPRGDA